MRGDDDIGDEATGGVEEGDAAAAEEAVEWVAEDGGEGVTGEGGEEDERGDKIL